MSYGSAWQRETLTLKQIPPLRTLLQCCDEGLLIRVIIEEHAVRAVDWDALPSKRRRGIEKRLAATLVTMRRLPVRKKPKRPGLLLPDESFVLRAGDGLIERRVGASLVFLDEAPLARRAESGEDEGGVQPHGYTLDPWEDTLAHRVWLGGPWCCRERYLVLASAFWEMTYLGFEYDRVCARRAEVKAARLLEGATAGEGEGEERGAGPVEGSSDGSGASCSPSAATIVSAERRRQAASFGLVEPDPFERAYRDNLIACVARLNRERRQALGSLLIDVADRLEAS
ncbi:hypothetical protein [Eggerthella sinensis]|uniref:hypothetical protein n=1 Tax=Eggerthella sinensis TaxID=242230 RepID=UPI00266C8925|nr:hypothetical protein [Eggerthella sinensis]